MSAERQSVREYPDRLNNGQPVAAHLLGYIASINKQEYKIRKGQDDGRVHAEYVAETVRQLVYSQYGDETYTRGLNVYTTVDSKAQQAAHQSLRRSMKPRSQPRMVASDAPLAIQT